jgi:hypothetical protein
MKEVAIELSPDQWEALPHKRWWESASRGRTPGPQLKNRSFRHRWETKCSLYSVPVENGFAEPEDSECLSEKLAVFLFSPVSSIAQGTHSLNLYKQPRKHCIRLPMRKATPQKSFCTSDFLPWNILLGLSVKPFCILCPWLIFFFLYLIQVQVIKIPYANPLWSIVTYTFGEFCVVPIMLHFKSYHPKPILYIWWKSFYPFFTWYSKTQTTKT